MPIFLADSLRAGAILVLLRLLAMTSPFRQGDLKSPHARAHLRHRSCDMSRPRQIGIIALRRGLFSCTATIFSLFRMPARPVYFAGWNTHPLLSASS